MSGSKTSKKNGCTCKYVYVKGKKDGEICGAPSRGDFCKNHNKNRKEYNKKYFNKKAIRNLRDKHKIRIRKFKKMQVESKIKLIKVMAQHTSFGMTIKKWEAEAKSLLGEFFVIKLILGTDKENKYENFLSFSEKGNKLYEKYIINKKDKNGDDIYEPNIEELNERLEKLERNKLIIIKKIKQYGEYIDILWNHIRNCKYYKS